MLCIIPTLLVLSFFFNSRFLQTVILQTGPNQFEENQKQNQDNTGRFSMKNLTKRLEFFLPKRPVPVVTGQGRPSISWNKKGTVRTETCFSCWDKYESSPLLKGGRNKVIPPLITPNKPFRKVIFGLFTLALIFAKTSSDYDRFAICVPVRPRLARWNKTSPKGPRGISGNGGISKCQKQYLRRRCILVIHHLH